jgi:holin-like protein
MMAVKSRFSWLVTDMKAIVRQCLQMLLFVAVWLGAERLVEWTGWPVPAAVLGLFAVLALLGLGVLPERFVADGAARFLGDMVLFFIPPLVAAVQYGPLLESHGLPIVADVVLGTLAVLVGTAFVTERTLRWESRRHARSSDGGASP